MHILLTNPIKIVDFLSKWSEQLFLCVEFRLTLASSVMTTVYVTEMPALTTRQSDVCFFLFNYDLGQKYQAPQVRLNWGSNS